MLQVNGRICDKILVACGLTESELESLALGNEKVRGRIEGKKITTVKVVPDRLVNLAAG